MRSKKNARSGRCRHGASVISLEEYRRWGPRPEPGDSDDAIDAPVEPVAGVATDPVDPVDDEGGIILCW
ncbi:hypothetical protein [Mycolicibacterium goodii]|uniref:Uncharacterized protein n=1 Tax=Mycolicibacterium goodii TaxID=134601 RepID=A0A0K0X0V8_MYCGD|nr:hypothetical protein AFA91_03245 [Mycolicibacterium goodii]